MLAALLLASVTVAQAQPAETWSNKTGEWRVFGDSAFRRTTR